jgi:hypothetical protein
LGLPFDPVEFVRAVKDAPGLSQEAAEKMADALAVQLSEADTVDKRDLEKAVADLKNWSAGVGAVLFVALSAIKLFE